MPPPPRRRRRHARPAAGGAALGGSDSSESSAPAVPGRAGQVAAGVVEGVEEEAPVAARDGLAVAARVLYVVDPRSHRPLPAAAAAGLVAAAGRTAAAGLFVDHFGVLNAAAAAVAAVANTTASQAGSVEDDIDEGAVVEACSAGGVSLQGVVCALQPRLRYLRGGNGTVKRVQVRVRNYSMGSLITRPLSSAGVPDGKMKCRGTSNTSTTIACACGSERRRDRHGYLLVPQRNRQNFSRVCPLQKSLPPP